MCIGRKLKREQNYSKFGTRLIACCWRKSSLMGVVHILSCHWRVCGIGTYIIAIAKITKTRYQDEEQHLAQIIWNFSSLVLPRSGDQCHCHQRFLDLATKRASNLQLRGVLHFGTISERASRTRVCVPGVNAPNLHNCSARLPLTCCAAVMWEWSPNNRSHFSTIHPVVASNRLQ